MNGNTPKDIEKDNFEMKGSANGSVYGSPGLNIKALKSLKDLSIKHLIQYCFVFMFHYLDTRMKGFIGRVFSDIVITSRIILRIRLIIE